MKKKEILFPSKMQFKLNDLKEEPLKSGQIKGKTIYSLVSPGTELGWASGDNFPIRPGYSAVFEVTETANDVQGIETGSLRFCMGEHRSIQQIDVKYTLPIPKNLALEKAVIARLMGVSLTTLMNTEARPGDWVCICGAGPVGYLAAHQFNFCGYKVYLVEPDDMRRSQVRDSGIDTSFAKMPVDDPRLTGRTALVLDCSGHEQAVLDGCRMVKHGGEVVLVGVPWKKITNLSAHDILQAVFFNNVRLRS